MDVQSDKYETIEEGLSQYLISQNLQVQALKMICKTKI